MSNSIAKERIEILFKEAERVFKKNPTLAKRYIYLIKKLQTKTNSKLSSEQKRKFCKKCNSFLKPGVNCKVRTNPRTKCIEYFCECGKISRFGYSKEKKKSFG